MTPPSPPTPPLPALEPPGTGLPPWERRFSLVLLATVSVLTPRLGAQRRFEREAVRIVTWCNHSPTKSANGGCWRPG
jgi:hypothetical protein